MKVFFLLPCRHKEQELGRLVLHTQQLRGCGCAHVMCEPCRGVPAQAGWRSFHTPGCKRSHRRRPPSHPPLYSPCPADGGASDYRCVCIKTGTEDTAFWGEMDGER